MRSLIILEVEHGETTDALGEFLVELSRLRPDLVEFKDYSVRVDLPPCFVLDSGNTENKE